MSMYKVKYVDWKGRDSFCWLCAISEQEAAEMAMVMQGVYKITSVEEAK